MNESPTNSESRLRFYLGEPTPGLFDRVVELLRARHWRFLVAPAARVSMQAGPDRTWERC
jgi:hypothetical protein